jgi:hypothetical protein
MLIAEEKRMKLAHGYATPDPLQAQGTSKEGTLR